MIKKRFTSPKLDISRESLKLYSFNLSDPAPEIRPKVEVEVFTRDRPLELGLLQASIIEQRISQGDKIFVACHQLKPVAYLFAATKNCWVNEIQDWFIVESGEVYLYNAFTTAEHRGNHIYSFLISNAAKFFKGLTYSYALIFTTASNIRSIRGIERTGFQCYDTIHFHNLFGLRIWNYKPRSNDVKSRFSNEI